MANKMTTCKVCGTEVAKSATVCPHCGARLKKKHTVLGIIIGLIIVVIILASVGGSYAPQKIEDNSTSIKTSEVRGTEQNTQTEFGVGDKVELNNVIVTLVSVTETEGSQYNKPTDGNVFVLCEFEIENDSNSEITVSSMLSFEAYCDDYACNYSLSALMEKGNKNQLDGQVAAGKKFNGVVGYEVPADWKELELRFSPNFWAGKKITFIASH